MKCELADADLIIRDEQGRVRWRGKPAGYRVQALSPLEKDGGVIVLLDRMAGPKSFANLLRVQTDRAIAWQANPPDHSGSDAFVEFRWDGDELIANSWSGYLLRLDPITGAVRSQVFVK